MNIKKILLLLIIILLPLPASACWDRIEVDETAIVIGFGVDKIPGSKPFLITVQIVNPTANPSGQTSGGGGKPFLVLSSKGTSFFDAVRNFSTIAPRKLLFSHNKMIILGEGLARSGIAQVMDYMDRDREFRRTSWVLVAKGPAKKIVESQVPIEVLPAKGIEIMMIGFKRTAFVPPVNRNIFVSNFKSDTKVSYAPIIKLQNKKMEISKTAIFKNTRMIGGLTTNESRGLLWLKNELKGGVVTVPFETKAAEKRFVSIDINKGKTEITPVFSSKGIMMKITCEGSATLREAENTRIQIESKKAYKDVTSMVNAVVKSRIESTIDIAQKKYNADFVGFANTIHNYSPKEWHRVRNRWAQVFPKIPYTVAVDVKITKFGMIRDSTLENFGED